MATDIHALPLCIVVALQALFGLIWLFTRREPDASSTLMFAGGWIADCKAGRPFRGRYPL